ncbi:MAG: hypothetical protein Kow0069_09280 [Promethearchaeota archaeon]
MVEDLPRVAPVDPRRGSNQGPSEVRWGYACPTWFDWDGDGRPDVVYSEINGLHWVALATGTEGDAPFPRLSPPRALVDVDAGVPLKTAWRVRPAPLRHPNGEVDYFCLDEAGALARYEKVAPFGLRKAERVATTSGRGIYFTKLRGGALGRVKLCWANWFGEGPPDLLAGLPAAHDLRDCGGETPVGHAAVVVFRNAGSAGEPRLEAPRYLIHRRLGRSVPFGRHSCSPEYFEREGRRYLLVGAEDGHFYLFGREEFR